MSTYNSPPTSPPSAYTSPPPRMKPGYWVLLVFGMLAAVLGLVLSAIGVTAMSIDAAQRDGRYLEFATEDIQTTGYALVSESLTVELAEPYGAQGLQPGEIASIQVMATSSVPDQEIFIGIGPSSDVSSYLQDVPYSHLGNVSGPTFGYDTGPWFDTQEKAVTAGTSAPSNPAEETFWTQSASGTETQEVTWDLEAGQWSLVIMNADASRPVWVEVQAAVRSDLTADVLGSAGAGLLLTGLLALTVGILLLLLGAAGLGRSMDTARNAGIAGRLPDPTVYPARLTGRLDQPLSRWLWLVKWLLGIPHYFVLLLLGFTVVFTTIASGIAILFTGRYPRSWFFFSVGVLRWTWRVGFYLYAALGTDRYPPFTLASVEYPADFDVSYPERLSRGLVLVKWWLLAIPHLLIVGILTTGSMGATWVMSSDMNTWVRTSTGAPSLLAVLVIIAAVILLFTARYRAGLFALIMGINRWAYRVSTYVLLLRDEYPPFRLDQGPVEPRYEETASSSASGPMPG